MKKDNTHITKAELEQIFLTHYGSLVTAGLKTGADRAQAQDAIQSLFLELWEKQINLANITYLNAYLCKSLVRKLLHESKKGTTQPLSALDAHATPSYEELLIAQQTNQKNRHRLQRALDALPAQQREVLRLRFFAGMSYDEIAEQRGKSKQTVYNQIFSALRKLKDILLLLTALALLQ